MSLLKVKMQKNDAGAKTIGEYLQSLLCELWANGEGFSAKRPFGNSGWEHDLYMALVKAKLVKGKIVDGYLEEFDEPEANEIVYDAIAEMTGK